VNRATQSPQSIDILGVLIASFPLLGAALSLPALSIIPAIWSLSLTMSMVICLAYIVMNLGTALRVVPVMVPLFVLAALYLLDFVITPTGPGIRHTLALVAMSIIIWFYLSFGGKLLNSRLFRSIVLVEAILLFFAGLLGMNVKNFDIGTSYYALCIIFFLLIPAPGNGKTVLAVVFFVVACVVGLVFDFRALLYLSLINLFFYMIFNTFRFNSIVSMVIFLLFLFFMFLAFYFYNHMDDYDITRQLNMMVQDYSGRQLASGRQLLWPPLVESGLTSPWIGLGGGILPMDILDTDLSSHNYYLQLFIQKGALGLFVLFCFLLMIWLQFGRLMWRDARVNYSAALFLTFLLHNFSEVLLLQNALVVALPAWILVSLGMGLVGPSR
jgi:hypothetical protein